MRFGGHGRRWLRAGLAETCGRLVEEGDETRVRRRRTRRTSDRGGGRLAVGLRSADLTNNKSVLDHARRERFHSSTLPGRRG